MGWMDAVRYADRGMREGWVGRMRSGCRRSGLVVSCGPDLRSFSGPHVVPLLRSSEESRCEIGARSPHARHHAATQATKNKR